MPGTRRRASFGMGAELGRVAETGVPLELGSISPAAVEILLVNEEIAQPAQEAASLGCGVLIRGVVAVASEVAGGGKTLSGIVDANLRTR